MKIFRIKPLALALALAGVTGAANADSVGWIKSSELDTTISPCSDLNGFVNAKWVAANPIPSDRTRWGAFDQLAEKSLDAQHEIVEAAAKNVESAKAGTNEQKIGSMYRSGMDETAVDKAGFDPIKPDLAKIAALKANKDVASYLRESFADGHGSVFRFGSRADYNDAKTQIASAGQGGLGLPTPDYYSKDEYAEQRKAYVEHIAKTLELTGVAADEAKKQADTVLKFETRLAAASLSRVELRDPKNQYHFVSVAEADQVMPHFAWEPFFAAQGVKVEKGFSLSQPKFFAEFDKMLADVPVADWQAYLRFHTIDGAAQFLSKPFQDQHFAFHGQALNGQKEQSPRWKRVLEAVDGGMGMALGEMYVAQNFPPQAKARAKQLVDDVRNALRARIEKLDWMSDETKKKALAKWDTFLPKIGYPDKWRDYSSLTIDKGDLAGNVQRAAQFDYQRNINKLGKPIDRGEWGMTPQTLNAYYNPELNEIVFPAAILQPPYFDASADDAVNYGGIGAVIGHEISHGFDDQGAQYDGDGNLRDWWTKEDHEKFAAKTKALVAEYNAFEPVPGYHINGELTLGENIADNSGLAVAFKAYHISLGGKPGPEIDGLTGDQRFYMGYAAVWRAKARDNAVIALIKTDPHSQPQARAMGTVVNQPGFYQAFDVKEGDKMYRAPDQRVTIW
jgi:putative endopeptidase